MQLRHESKQFLPQPFPVLHLPQLLPQLPEIDASVPSEGAEPAGCVVGGNVVGGCEIGTTGA
jgi:hypothetical protein